MNWIYNYDFLPRIDRLFEMHPIWIQAQSKKPEYEKPRKHWRWLQEQHPYPIYMLEYRPEVPACVPYPLDKVSRDLFGVEVEYQNHRPLSLEWLRGLFGKGARGIWRGDQQIRVFGSSVDYMVGLAIYEKFRRIELYGVEMGSHTEYRYQRESLMLLIGIALARGIEIYMPENSILFNKTKLYGLEGGQMIYRQDAERLYGKAMQKFNDELSKLQFMEGRLANTLEMELIIDDPARRKQLEDELREQEGRKRAAEMLMLSFEYILREIDGEEVTEIEIPNSSKVKVKP